jgi:hypothetical protein
VLEDAARRITRQLQRRGLFAEDGAEDTRALTAPEGEASAALAELAATAASGMTPPAGPSCGEGRCRRRTGHLSGVEARSGGDG